VTPDRPGERAQKARDRAEIERLFKAIAAGEVDEVRSLLDADPGLAAVRDDEGMPALLAAVYRGQAEIAGELLARRGELDVWEAAAVGDAGRLARLLDGDPRLADAPAPDGYTPLGLAAFFGRVEAVELLVARGADVNAPARNATRVRPLHSAVAHRGPEAALQIAGILLAAGASANVAQQGGWTPLHQAAAHGQTALVELLLEHGADAAARSDDGQTALDLARRGAHGETARRLQQGG
jgi:ankyrin repeat protein